MITGELNTYMTLYKQDNIIKIKDSFENSLIIRKSEDLDFYNFLNKFKSGEKYHGTRLWLLL